MAFFLTNLPHRPRQQDIFANNIREFNPTVFIKTDLSFTFVDREFMGSCVVWCRTVEKIKPGIYRAANRLQAAVALRLDLPFERSPVDTDLPESVTE